MIILDTDTCIEILRGNTRVIHRRELEDDDVGIGFVTLGELYYGAEKSDNPRKNYSLIEQFMLSVVVFQTDNSILRRFGQIKASLRKAGATLADADILIAATTLEKGQKLVTGNFKHFERIDGLVTGSWK